MQCVWPEWRKGFPRDNKGHDQAGRPDAEPGTTGAAERPKCTSMRYSNSQTVALTSSCDARDQVLFRISVIASELVLYGMEETFFWNPVDWPGWLGHDIATFLRKNFAHRLHGTERVLLIHVGSVYLHVYQSLVKGTDLRKTKHSQVLNQTPKPGSKEQSWECLWYFFHFSNLYWSAQRGTIRKKMLLFISQK